MATYSTKRTDSTRYSWLVPLPTNPTELSKAWAGAEQMAWTHGINTKYDDWLTVVADEEQIEMYFEVRK